MSELVIAAENGDLAEVEKQLQIGVNVDSTIEDVSGLDTD